MRSCSALLCLAFGLLAVPALARAPCRARAGDARLLIRARLLIPAGSVRRGELLADAEGRIACIGACRAQAKGATLIDCPDALLSPGFVNLHEHLMFGGVAPRPDDGIRYTHRHDWRKGLNGFRARENFAGTRDPALLAWFELRHLLAGETALAGNVMARGLARNLDVAAGLEGLDAAAVTNEVFPLDDATGIERIGDCDYGPHPETAAGAAARHALLVHLGEGSGEAARNEFRCTTSAIFDTAPLPAGGGTSQDLLQGNATVLHGIAFDPAMLAELARRRVDLVWSPRSNLSLYGRTLDVGTALSLGMTIALGTDWLPSGSMTLVREADCAKHYAETAGLRLPSRLLWRMMTANGAAAARMTGRIGVLAPGAAADLILVRAGRQGADPFAAVTSASPRDMLVIARGGRILAGDARLLAPLPRPDCEEIAMGRHRQRLCIAADAGLSYADLARQAAAAGAWPAFFADRPPIEPTCRASVPVALPH
jgi:cytosine/adenosine deaminase-related metal-dependent hydrolase